MGEVELTAPYHILGVSLVDTIDTKATIRTIVAIDTRHASDAQCTKVATNATATLRTPPTIGAIPTRRTIGITTTIRRPARNVAIIQE